MFHVIDDEVTLRDMLNDIISYAGYAVLCFESGDKYLSHLKSPEYKKPIAVLSDITMPGINGYDLALEIREKHPFQKIVLITGNADPEHHQRADSQLCHTLNKPYHPSDLIAMLETLFTCYKSYSSNNQANYPLKCSIDNATACPFHPHNQPA